MGDKIVKLLFIVCGILVLLGCEELWIRQVAFSQAYPEVVLEIAWGSYGTGEGEFDYPNGIAVDSNGFIYVADSGNSRIQKFDSNGDFILEWGSAGNEAGEFSFNESNYTNHIAIDSTDNVYVRAGSNQVHKFDSNGTYLLEWSITDVPGEKNPSLGGFSFGLDDLLYAADGENNRVLVFDQNGVYQNQFSARSEGEGIFSYPHDIAVSSSGHIYIVHNGGSSNTGGIVILDSEGSYIDERMGTTYQEQPQFIISYSYIVGLTVDADDGIVFQVNMGGDCSILKTDLDFSFSYQLGGRSGSEEGIFNDVRDIAVDAMGNLYLADSGNHRIQKFAPSK
ncbi:MAG: hypothetical protein HN368_03875 [Spirochaetales bacterium]|jgi:tripartite motif-containing protein 71|nr:hypothetical protein [Spirochaetales bacterium]